jgi:hypothetical protein
MVHDRSKSQVLEDVTNYSVEADCPTAVDGVAYREMNILTFEDVTIEKDVKLPQKLQISKRQPSNMRHYTDTADRGKWTWSILNAGNLLTSVGGLPPPPQKFGAGLSSRICVC